MTRRGGGQGAGRKRWKRVAARGPSAEDAWEGPDAPKPEDGTLELPTSVPRIEKVCLLFKM